MGSQLGIFRRRFFDRQAAVSRARLSSLLQPQPIPVRTFGGYTPDLPASLSQPGDATFTGGLTIRKGRLCNDYGWAQFGDNLPLGENVPPAAATREEGVIGGPIRYTEAVAAQTRRTFVITNENFQAFGHLYELVGATWTNRAYDTTPGPQGAAGGITGADSDLVDWAYFPASNQLVWCNGVVAGADLVEIYPRSGASEYTDFNQTEGSRTALDFDPPNLNFDFKAMSVEAFDDRLIFLGTEEEEAATTYHPARARWTTIGANASLTGTGSGFIDLHELSTGLRVLRLGNRVACYFDDGVAFLTKTGLATDAFRREYVSQVRGLISRQGVVNLGSGVHFGVFTDGWFLLDSNGVWTEVGLRNINGTLYPKWRDTFYETIAADNDERLTLKWDNERRTVRMSFPSGEALAPDTIWNWHLDTDTAWVDDFESAGSYSAQPNTWGSGDRASTAETWATVTTTWDTETRTWEEEDPGTQPEFCAWGTTDGRVYKMDRTLETRDGNPAPYSYQAVAVDGGQLDQIKQLDTVHFTYQRRTGANPMTIALHSDEKSESTAISHTKGNVGTLQTDLASAPVAGTRVGWGVSGSGPVALAAVQLNVQLEGNIEVKDN